MTIREKHIARRRRARRGAFAAFVAGVAALCCVACINEYPDAAPQVQGPSLALMVSLMDIEDDPKDAANELERMHNLRVIITHNTDGGNEEIEYNRYIDFDDSKGEGKYKYGYLEDLRLIFLVRQEWIGKARNVYLFANSEPIFDRMFTETEGLSGHLDPEEGAYGGNHRKDFDPVTTETYLKAIKDVTFTNEELQKFVTKGEDSSPANGIPMSAEYRDVEFKPGNTGIANISVFNSYIVRAANKITFTYINDRLMGDIAVKNWQLQYTADKSWLLPHVPAEKNSSLFGTGTDYDNWIAWYAKHIGSGGHEEELEFDTPEGVVMSPFSDDYEAEATVRRTTSDNTTTETVKGLRVPQRGLMDREPTPAKESITYYFLESRYIPEGADAQRYTMRFNTLEYQNTPTTDESGEHYWQPSSYPAGAAEAYHLDQVKTLLRNTHVIITATFADKGQLDLEVSIKNWHVDAPVEGQLKPE